MRALCTLAVVSIPMFAFSQNMPQVTVAATGKADFHTVQEAVDHAPDTGEVIRILPGTYQEKIHISKPNVWLIGTGETPQAVVLRWNDSAHSSGSTFKSGSVTVDADGFAAENLTIENTWELEHERTEEGAQAVALLMSSDKAVLDRVRLLGAQDTLYANSRTCHTALPADGSAPQEARPACAASRQYFHDCYIEGHVDYIFGDAKAVFDHCEMHSRHHETVMITAQSRHFPEEDSGYYFLHGKITGENVGDRVYFGRPWRDYSTVLFYDTEIQQTMAPAGWLEWAGRLKTSTYLEYKSHGPGVNGGARIVKYPALTAEQEAQWNPKSLLQGTDRWDPEKAAERLRKMRK